MQDPETIKQPRKAPERGAPPRAGELCPHCGFAALRAEPKGHVRCPVCGFSSAPPCT